MKLISMTSFVLEQRMTSEEISKASFYNIQTHIHSYYDNVFAYANFLKQPLTLGMFVPCYDDGQLHEKPGDLAYQLAKENNHTASKWAIEEYNEAKERVLFKDARFDRYGKLYCGGLLVGWKVSGERFYIDSEFKTIENVADKHREIELTESAIKKIGL